MTINNDYMTDAVRAFAKADPILDAWFEQSTHTAWPVSRYNCRKIAGSNRWSRHSWPGGDAADIMRLTKGVDGWPLAARSAPYVGAEPGDPFDPSTWGDWYPLDAFYFWLLESWTGLDNIIYRRQKSDGSWDHLDHIHVDYLHHGVNNPPCNGGPLETVNPTGGFVLTISETGGPRPPVPPPRDEFLTVADFQAMLAEAGFDPGPIDGIMGPNTFGAGVDANKFGGRDKTE